MPASRPAVGLVPVALALVACLTVTRNGLKVHDMQQLKEREKNNSLPEDPNTPPYR